MMIALVINANIVTATMLNISRKSTGHNQRQKNVMLVVKNPLCNNVEA